ncbi:hypothetical protein HPB52_001358 [Rhipicephalus sanguineus]|uniref:Uncharacterized protein n=1 Tax=Rhipicephalus sanguineus TaxID=34632 RepID=A0A9D4QGF1_RHISA|nr:hypothetical protein HPB52_001358 [Rhipicephalus sanguineus]
MKPSALVLRFSHPVRDAVQELFWKASPGRTEASPESQPWHDWQKWINANLGSGEKKPHRKLTRPTFSYGTLAACAVLGFSVGARAVAGDSDPK